MYKDDSNLQSFGLSFRFKDIWHSIVLILLYYLGSYFVSILIYYIAPSFYNIQPKNNGLVCIINGYKSSF